MKRYIPLLILASVALAACDKQIVQLEVETRVKPVDTEFIDGQPTVYAVCSDSTFAWAPGDSISVLETNGTDYAFKTFTTSASGRRAMFIGPVLEKGWSMTEMALFPANPGHLYDGTAFSYVLGDSFVQEGGNLPVAMLATSAEERVFAFDIVSGAIAFKLSNLEPGDHYTVELGSSLALAGVFSLSSEGAFDAPSVTAPVKKQAVSVLADADGKATAVFPLVPRTYTSLTVDVFVSSGKKSFSDAYGNVLVMKGAVKEYAIDVPAVLTPQQAMGDLSEWASVANIYSESNVYGGTPDYMNNVSGELSPTLEVKFRSDADFLFGYIKIDTTLFTARDENHDFILNKEGKKVWGPASSMNNFTVWADNDDVHKNQSVSVGHFWLYTGYDKMIRGAAFSSCKPKEWKPVLRNTCGSDGNQPIYGGEAFGTAVEPAPADVGYGDGTFADGIIEWQFVVSRDALGIAGMSSAHIGLSFDEGWAGWSLYTVIPDKNGFDVELSNE